MKSFITLAIVLAMLLATGCQQTEIKPQDTTSSEVTDAAGNPVVTDDPDVTVTDEVAGPAVTTTVENESDAIVGSQNTPLNEPISTEGMTEMYLSYFAQSDKDGNIESVSNYTYDENGNMTEYTQISGDRIERWVNEYDKNGFITKEMYFSGDLLVEYYQYTNDENGNVTSMRYYNPNGTVNYDNPIVNYDIKFDSKGRLVEMKNYISENKYNHTSCEYDDFGNMLRRRIISADGMLLILDEFNYDEQGRLTLESHTNANDTSLNYSYTTTFVSTADGATTAMTRHTGTDFLVEMKTYDASGNLMEHYVYDENGVLFNKHVYEYQASSAGDYQKSVITTDIDGKIVSQETITYAQDGTLVGETHIAYTYDEDGTQHTASTMTAYLQTADYGNYKQVIDKVDGELFCEEITRYDDNGNVTEITTKLSDTTQEEIYERDENGNITKLTRYVDGEVVATLDYEYIRIEGAWHFNENS